jgi:hypothetical protein
MPVAESDGHRLFQSGVGLLRSLECKLALEEIVICMFVARIDVDLVVFSMPYCRSSSFSLIPFGLQNVSLVSLENSWKTMRVLASNK